MGCLCSKSEPIIQMAELDKNSKLFMAQKMTITLSGHKINSKVFHNINDIMNEKNAKEVRKDPHTNPDFKLVFSPPFNKCQRLLDYLYLTGVGGLTKENLIRYKITLIINATYEWYSLQTKTITTYRIPVDDSDSEDISIYFDEVSDKLEECHQKGGNALIHCMAGCSRSITLVLGLLSIAFSNDF